MMPHSALKEKNQVLIAITATTPMGLALLGRGFNLKRPQKFSTLIKYDVHREHNDEPTAVDKDRTYSFGLENTHHFNEQTSLITFISYDKRDASRAEKFENNVSQLTKKCDLPRLISVIKCT